MRISSASTVDGITEQLFTVGDVPGVLWLPEDAIGPRPLVLIGHGGGQHKKATGVLARAQRYVRTAGFAAAAIDAPNHGDRPVGIEYTQFAAERGRRAADGEPVGELIDQYNTALAAQAVPEWRATLDALQDLDVIGAESPVGYWGVSLGTAIGLPLVAFEKRITAAVLGLLGNPCLAEQAAQIAVPLQFLLQWDDELVPRESALALFDAFASPEKTLHANPGRHAEVPRFEIDSAERFFQRHLSR